MINIFTAFISFPFISFVATLYAFHLRISTMVIQRGADIKAESFIEWRCKTTLRWWKPLSFCLGKCPCALVTDLKPLEASNLEQCPVHHEACLLIMPCKGNSHQLHRIHLSECPAPQLWFCSWNSFYNQFGKGQDKTKSMLLYRKQRVNYTAPRDTSDNIVISTRPQSTFKDGW